MTVRFIESHDTKNGPTRRLKSGEQKHWTASKMECMSNYELVIFCLFHSHSVSHLDGESIVSCKNFRFNRGRER